MSRLNTPEATPAEAQETIDAVRGLFGFVPNMFQTLGSNPVVLDIVMTLQAKQARLLDARTRHTVALAVSQANGCDYCLALHTRNSVAQGGMSDEEIELARAGSSIDPKRAAAARFAQRVIETRGQVSDADLSAVRAAYTDQQIIAIVAVSVVTLLTNYINNVNQTIVDIPAAGAIGSSQEDDEPRVA